MKAKWKDEEIKSLFSLVERNNNKNIATLNSFKEFAKISNRNALSVRNFYYSYVKFLQTHNDVAKSLNIDLSKHLIQKFEHFSQEKENELIKDIDALISKGYSVRSACQELANNDINIMLRLQNKYRSLKKQNNVLKENATSLNAKVPFANKNFKCEDFNYNNKKNYNNENKLTNPCDNINENINVIEKKSSIFAKNNKKLEKNIKNSTNLTNFRSFESFESLNENLTINENKSANENSKENHEKDFITNEKTNLSVIPFPIKNAEKSKQELSDDDIKSLFLGLVKLVKENAETSAKNKNDEFIKISEQQKRKEIVLIEHHKAEMNILKNQIEELKNKNKELNLLLAKYRIDFLNLNPNNENLFN